MNRSREINSVIFDMDSVITQTMPLHCRVWKKIFSEEGIHLTNYQIYEREGQKGLESVREIFALHNIPFDLSRAGKMLERKETLFKSLRQQTRFIPNARTFIRMLRKKGLHLALVSGTSRHEINHLLSADFLKNFRVIVSGSDVSNGKPHPEPYLKALAALRLKNSQAIVIENAPYGIASAKAAGLTCFAVQTSLPASYLSQADFTFRDIKSIAGFLQEKRWL
jgi:HAD superfamily hydrolase (TIGR01509 family)